jgi:hypothetical protein
MPLVSGEGKSSMQCLALLMVLSIGCSAGGAEPVLPWVTQGRSTWRIYHAADAVPSVREAATDLQRVVHQATGAQLPITHEPGTPMICLGDNPSAVAAGIDVKCLVSDAFIIRTVQGNLYIAGPDTAPVNFSFDAGPLPGGGKHPAGTAQGGESRGTANGVYAFLEDVVGVRWLLPGEVGEDIPTRDSLAIPVQDRHEAPGFASRVISVVQNTPQSGVPTWQRRLKLGSSMWESTNHSHHITLEQSSQHPEWWPMRNGKRVNSMTGARSDAFAKFCMTEPTFQRAMADALIAQIDGWQAAGLNRMMASASPCDGDGDTWCHCDRCRARWESSAAGPYLGARFYTQSRTPMLLDFYNSLARDLQSRRPGAVVGGFAYASFSFPPQQAMAVEPNVFLMLAPRVYYGMTLLRPQYAGEFARLVGEWRRLTPNLGYYCVDTWMRNQLGAPLPPSLPILKLIYPVLHENQVQAVNHYGLEAWGYGAVHNYVVARLLWNPHADVDAIYDEFMHRAYGGGAPAMMRIYDLLQSQFTAYKLAEDGFSYDMSSELIAAVHLPHHRQIEAWCQEALAGAQQPRQKQRVQMFIDNMRVLHHALAKAAALEKPEESMFHLDDQAYAAFREEATHGLALARWYKTQEAGGGFIESITLPKPRGSFVSLQRQLDIPRRSSSAPAPVLDGRLDDAAWKQAAVSEPFVQFGATSPAQPGTQTLAFYDDDALYIAFRCAEAAGQAMVANAQARDDMAIYRDDAVELFIASTADHDRNWHLTANIAGVQWDAWAGDMSRNLEWNCVAAMDADGGGWSMEIRVPFSSLGLDAPPVGGTWRGNFCRQDAPAGQASSWSNVEKSFLKPEHFGIWRFRP